MRSSRESLNRGTLALAFLAGSGGILYFRLQDFTIYEVIGLPIAVLFVYWMIALAISDKRIYDIIGDNCYYLGFVFTLTSLAVTLYQLYEPADAAPQDQLLGKTIAGFGVALSSTIAGIVLRVLMQRMAPDIAQQESETRVDFDLAVRDFRTHLSMSIGELKRYSVETSQILAEQRDAIRKTLAQDTDAHRQALESSSTALTRFSEETESKLSEHWAAVEEGVAHDAETYRVAAQESVSAFRKALKDITETISERHGSIREALQHSSGEYGQILESTMADLRRVLGDAVQAIAEYREEVGQLANLSRTTFEQTGESAEAVRNELERMKALTGGIVTLSRESHGLDAALSGLVGTLARVEDGIATKLEPAVARIGESASTVSTTLADSSGKLKSAAENFEAAAERTTAADLQTNIAGAAERIADAAERLETANTALSTAIGKLGDLADRRPDSSWPLGNLFNRGR